MMLPHTADNVATVASSACKCGGEKLWVAFTPCEYMRSMQSSHVQIRIHGDDMMCTVDLTIIRSSMISVL